jgi:hypothetical protein
MKKIFEDEFTKLQADMVSICLENVENRAEKIYIYCSFEDRVVSSGLFYKINGHILQKHKLNDGIRRGEKQYDVSLDRLFAVIKIINDDIKAMIKLCKEYDRDMPTQIKLIYNVEKNSLNADLKYDIMYSNHPTKTAYDMVEEWFAEVKKQEENK